VFIPLKEYSGTFFTKLVSQPTLKDFFITGLFRDILICEDNISF
jgi:hypothetical protein